MSSESLRRSELSPNHNHTEAPSPLSLILQMQHLITRMTSLEEGLNQMLHLVANFWQPMQAFIFTLDSSRQRLILSAQWPIDVAARPLLPLPAWADLIPWLNEDVDCFLQITQSEDMPVLQQWAQRLALDPLPRNIRLIPLHIGTHHFGLLCLTNMAVSETTNDPGLFQAAAQQIVLLLERFLLHQQSQKAVANLLASFVASNALVSSRDPVQVLHDMVEQAQQVAKASGVRMVLIDWESGEPVELIATGDDRLTAQSAVRPHGLSMQILRTGQLRLVEDARLEADQVNPSFFSRGIIAAAGLPVFINEEPIGVMWVYYDKPQQFSEPDINALKLYVNQAALAYDNARRMKQLEQMRAAAAALAHITTLPTVLHEAVRQARKVLGADSAVLWVYDEQRRKFMPSLSAADGVPPEWWQAARQAEPHSGGQVLAVMEKGWLGVSNLQNDESGIRVGADTRERLTQIGVQSYQAIALTVGDNKLGALFLNYKRRRRFSSQEQAAARTFAHHVALALNNTRLVEQLGKIGETAGTVANMAALAPLNETLKTIAGATQMTLGSDIVMLYVYDEDKARLQHPPTIEGSVRYPERPQPITAKGPESLLFKVMGHNEPMYVADDVRQDPWFKSSRFSREEQIASCISVALRARNRTVGVLFINYRQSHRFTSDEISHLRLFADQAAVAIYNAQLFEKGQKHAQTLRALERAAHAVTSALTPINEIFAVIAEQAWRLTGVSGMKARFSHLALIEGNHLTFEATYPPEQLHLLQKIVGMIDISHPEKIGITGQAVRWGRPVLVNNVREHAAYIEYDPETRSELAVPIKDRNKVIGVINVEHPETDAFDEQDVQALLMLAEYATIALENARLYRQMERHTDLLDAAAHVAAQASRTLDEEQLLNDTVNLIPHRFPSFYHAAIFLMDAARANVSLRVASSYDGEQYIRSPFMLRVGKQGIVGHVAHTGEAYQASDTRHDPYHWPNPLLPETRAEMAFPLLARGEVLGVLDVQSREIATLPEEDIATLQTMADQLAYAILNARLFGQAEKRALAFQAVYEAGQAVSGKLNIEQILETIVEQAWKLTGSDGHKSQTSGLALANGNEIRFVAAYPHQRLPIIQKAVGTIRLGESERIGITGRTFLTGKPQLVNDVSIDPDYIVSEPTTSANLAVPIFVEGQVAGVIVLDHPQKDAFTEEDLQVLSSLAAQAGLALRNANYLREAQILQKVAARLAGTLHFQDVLQLVLRAALDLTDTHNSGILFWNAAANQYIPAYMMDVNDEQPYEYQTGARVGQGYTHQILMTRRSIIIPDARLDPHINPITLKKGRRSLIGVPLLQGAEAIGALYVHDMRRRQFSHHQVTVLEALSNQAVTAINRAWEYQELRETYESLRRTNNLVQARTALAFLGMDSGTRVHAIRNHARTILEQTQLIRADLETLGGDAAASLESRLRILERQADLILQKPPTLPLTAEEGMQSLYINEFVKERAEQLWQNEFFHIARLELKLTLLDSASMRVSPEWLRRAFDMLVENAVDAVRTQPTRQITIGTAAAETFAHILITDTGPGLPVHIQEQIGLVLATKPQETPGLGMGLVMAQLIVQAYGGEIRGERGEEGGTTMRLCIPLEA